MDLQLAGHLEPEPVVIELPKPKKKRPEPPVEKPAPVVVMAEVIPIVEEPSFLGAPTVL